MTPEQQKLVIDNYNLIYEVTKHFTTNNREDLISEAGLGLCKAAERFDITKGYNFSTFAYRYIQGTCLLFLNTDKLIKPGRDSQQKYVNKFQICKLEDFLESPYEFFNFDRDDISRLLKDNVSDTAYSIFTLQLEGYTKKEIRQKLCITNKIYNSAIEEIRRQKNLFIDYL